MADSKKKSTAKKPAAKKPAAKKPAAKKPTTKKAASKKTTAKKSASKKRTRKPREPYTGPGLITKKKCRALLSGKGWRMARALRLALDTLVQELLLEAGAVTTKRKQSTVTPADLEAALLKIADRHAPEEEEEEELEDEDELEDDDDEDDEDDFDDDEDEDEDEDE